MKGISSMSLKPAERRKKIFKYMEREVAKKGYPPTVREICQALDIKSTSTVHSDINHLVAEGYLKKDPSKPRAIMLVKNDVPLDNAVSENKNSYPNSAPIQGSDTSFDAVDVPLLGNVAAGMPILAEQNVEDHFPIPSRFLHSGTNFLLNVRGDSMIEAGIMDGDYILVQEQKTANNGDIVVAMIDSLESEATVKTFYKENGHIRLQPENSSMSPIIVDNVTIVGKVRGVFRYF